MWVHCWFDGVCGSVDCSNISNTNARQLGMSSRTFSHKTLENNNYCSLPLLVGARRVPSSLMCERCPLFSLAFSIIRCILASNYITSVDWNDSTKFVPQEQSAFSLDVLSPSRWRCKIQLWRKTVFSTELWFLRELCRTYNFHKRKLNSEKAPERGEKF